MISDPRAMELDSSCNATNGDPAEGSDNENEDPGLDPVLVWIPSGRRMISGLLGLNVVLLGAALMAGQTFKPDGLKHQELEIFMLLLLGISVLWMLWYLLWARKQPISPHKDHHAGGITVTLVVMLFAACSLLLYVCRIGYMISMVECKPVPNVLSPFIEAPFLMLQTYLLWAHSQDCIHKHKIINRSGLMLILSTDLLLWLSAVTEDTVHVEIELEKDLNVTTPSVADPSDVEGSDNSTCQCSASAACLGFRKGYEVLYPFNIEYYLMAACVIYVMWKNVGRKMTPGHHHVTQKLTLRIVNKGGIMCGLVLGALVLIAGMTVFILYQVWVSHQELRFTAFLIFYGYHLAVLPVMCLSCLAGMLVHRVERRATEGTHNPTRSLDVSLLVAAALGQLALSYFSLVAALAVGTRGAVEDLDLSYSLLSLLQLILQNIFIIEGLHRHPKQIAKKKGKQQMSIFKFRKRAAVPIQEGRTDMSLMDTPDAAQEQDGKKPWTKRAMREICAFLILSNVMLWVIPAFGVHPQFENGLGKQFFGFSAWLVLINLGQPLSVFYRMHSVGALMELLISA